jgi:hypothetical protein
MNYNEILKEIAMLSSATKNEALNCGPQACINAARMNELRTLRNNFK